jgi:hypothetical protein
MPYLVDSAFAQFMRPVGRMGSPGSPASAEILRESAQGAIFARDLLRDGFVQLTEQNASLYARGLGVAEKDAAASGLRLIRGERALTAETVGGAKRAGPIARLPDTPEAPDILDAADLDRFLVQFIERFEKEGDPNNLLPRLRELETRLQELLQLEATTP